MKAIARQSTAICTMITAGLELNQVGNSLDMKEQLMTEIATNNSACNRCRMSPMTRQASGNR